MIIFPKNLSFEVCLIFLIFECFRFSFNFLLCACAFANVNLHNLLYLAGGTYIFVVLNCVSHFGCSWLYFTSLALFLRDKVH